MWTVSYDGKIFVVMETYTKTATAHEFILYLETQ